MDIPIKSGDLGGMDALLSTIHMPSGIPIAINGAVTATGIRTHYINADLDTTNVAKVFGKGLEVI